MQSNGAASETVVIGLDRVPVSNFVPELRVAELTGLSVKTLQRWRLLGVGPPFRKFGSAVRYSQAEVLSWIASAPKGGGGGRATHRPSP
jgi:predicted DNA-binding transcriptional regulator AlpA